MKSESENHSLIFPTIESTIGNTPLVRLQRMVPAQHGLVLAKLEGNNPAGSVKDRPAYNMIAAAEQRGQIKPGDTLIEATSGNTGIALAMVAAIKGYNMVLIMPDNLSVERRASMKAYAAELILVTQEQGMEGARDLAIKMQADGKGKVLNQFANFDNPKAHIATTGPELWQQTQGNITHFVSSMGTTGTITGASEYLKAQNSAIQIIGVQPKGEDSIPGIRRWPEQYLPEIYTDKNIDEIRFVSQADAEQTTRDMAAQEGIFAGVSSGGAMNVALQIATENPEAIVVSIVCDRGDRYLSTGVFDN
jgi:cysteine synthase B